MQPWRDESHGDEDDHEELPEWDEDYFHEND
jgi:hypothetical protein